MGERRALVIGAPNDRFGRLTFLPEVVRDLHRVVRDPQRGGCQPALPDGRDLLLGAAATHRKIVAAIKDAMAAANRDQATLFVYFCGHGVRKAEDFFLIGSDTRPDDVDLDTAFGLGYRLTGLLQSHPTLDGVMFLLDACHSGEVVANPVHGLFSAAMQGRIEFLTATRAEQVASKGCFSRSLTQLLTVGSPRTADPELLAYREHARLSQVPPAPSECRGMAKAVHLSLNGTSDAGLWLGRNPAADLRPALHGTTGADLVAQLTRDWQRRLGPLGSLATLLSSEISPIAITGGPATGKSALLAGLGRRSADDWGMGLDALVSVRPGGTLVQLADELADQLSRTEAYRSGKQRWQQATPITDQDAAPEFQRLITGPLAHLRPGDRIRIGIDAADQLDTVQRRRLIDAAADLPQVILLLTGRRLDEVSPTSRVELPDTDPDAVARLLVTLIDEPETRCQVTTLAGGEWLLSRILAGLWRAGQLRPGTAQLNLTDLPAAFDAAIATAQTAALQAPIDDVLRLLAAAPTGTWMPLNVLTAILERHAARCSATAVHPQLDATAVWARDALVALGELVARAEPGESTERLGPAHDKIATHLANRYGQAVVAASHSTIAEVLIQIIASDEAPVHVRAYATAHLSEHLHAAGRTPDALKHVPKLSTPADNLALWQVWHDRLAYQGENHLDVLTVRSSIAFWTGEVGDAAEALRLAEQLLPDQVRVLGPDHPEVLTTRHNVAFRVGEVGDAAGALRLLEQLLLDRVRVLGPDHPEVLMTRNNVAFWTGQAGDAAGALQLFEQL
ncbi:Tetratricopeptide repeat-containing protein, partial [Geodermatophilus obscurus]